MNDKPIQIKTPITVAGKGDFDLVVFKSYRNGTRGAVVDVVEESVDENGDATYNIVQPNFFIPRDMLPEELLEDV